MMSTLLQADRVTQDVADRMAGFAVDLNEDSLPVDIQRHLLTLLIDFFRVGSLGVDLPWTRKVRQHVFSLGGAPAAGILYSDEKIDVVRAAFLNGVIAGSLEWDDTHVGAMLHPGVVVWPAALAVGQMVGASRGQIVCAAAAGYEVMIRIGLAIQPKHFRRGYQSTATCGAFGSAVATAKLLGLDRTGIRDAIGLAAHAGSGITQFFLSGSEVKRVHAGKASAAGVQAALLADAGFRASSPGLEAASGFGSALAGSFDVSAIDDQLGQQFHIMRLQMKPHAVSARVLAAIEAAEALLARGVRLKDIDTVEIGVPKVIIGRLTNNAPADLQQAQMSAPFAVAMAFAYGAERRPPLVIGIDDCEMALQRPDICALSRRTSWVEDAEIERTSNTEYVSARVTVKLTNGDQLSEIVEAPLGCSDRPMTVDDLRERFRTVVGGRIRDDVLARWIDGLEGASTKDWANHVMSLRLRTAEGKSEGRRP
jgi:2-methylcitrate dehydratase PrpD